MTGASFLALFIRQFACLVLVTLARRIWLRTASHNHSPIVWTSRASCVGCPPPTLPINHARRQVKGGCAAPASYSMLCHAMPEYSPATQLVDSASDNDTMETLIAPTGAASLESVDCQKGLVLPRRVGSCIGTALPCEICPTLPYVQDGTSATNLIRAQSRRW